MSLEKSLDNLADAIRAQTAFFQSQAGAAPAPAKAAPATKAAPKDEDLGEGIDAGEVKAPASKKASTAKATSEPKAASAKAAPADDAIDPAYAPVKAAILGAIAGGHRTAVTAVLKEYDAKTGQDLDPSVYDEVLGKLDAIVNPDADAELA